MFQPLPLKGLTEGFTGGKKSEENEIYKLFTNVMRLHPPKVCLSLKSFYQINNELFMHDSKQ